MDSSRYTRSSIFLVVSFIFISGRSSLEGKPRVLYNPEVAGANPDGSIYSVYLYNLVGNWTLSTGNFVLFQTGISIVFRAYRNADTLHDTLLPTVPSVRFAQGQLLATWRHDLPKGNYSYFVFHSAQGQRFMILCADNEP